MRSIFAGCVRLFLWISEEKKIKGSLRKCLKVVGVKVLEGDKRAVCDTYNTIQYNTMFFILRG